MKWENKRGCMTKDLALMLGVGKGHLLRNFSRNRARFQDGEHVYVMAGEDMWAFKKGHQDMQRLTHCLLWTERGAYQAMQLFRAPCVKRNYIEKVFPYYEEGER